MNRLVLAAACLAGLWLSATEAQAQYGISRYRGPSRARLSPYLNLARGNDANIKRAGIKFKPLDKDMEGRQALATLTRIIGELQRAELRQHRMGIAAA